MRYAVLLRGVNLGSHNRIAMPDLRALLETLGHTNVTTYLQSGNAVITSDRTDADDIAQEIADALRQDMSIDTPVLVRDGAELAAVVRANPFAEAVATPKFLHVAFLSSAPSAQGVEIMDEGRYAPDSYAVIDRAAYLWYCNGSGRSKLSIGVLEKLGIVATARNWTTVLALAERTA